jgi:hypothetical protein
MKSRGILYSAEMIRAKMEGRKSMTRRLSGLNGINEYPNFYRYIGDSNSIEIPRIAKKYDDAVYHAFEDNHSRWTVHTCPFGKVGDLLYAKETFYEPLFEGLNGKYYYKADLEMQGWDFKWKPSIFMPKAAARIIDMITGIKAERLQDISTEDIIKEGIKIHTPVPGDGEPNPKLQFKNLWTSINGEESWHSNPWVWVIETENITTKGWGDYTDKVIQKLIEHSNQD